MSKHTPGPWEYLIETTGEIVAKQERGKSVVVVEADAANPFNARLIAQAPRLLDALEQIADYIEERIGDNECRPLENARAAIAAATEAKE